MSNIIYGFTNAWNIFWLTNPNLNIKKLSIQSQQFWFRLRDQKLKRSNSAEMFNQEIPNRKCNWPFLIVIACLTKVHSPLLFAFHSKLVFLTHLQVICYSEVSWNKWKFTSVPINEIDKSISLQWSHYKIAWGHY